jgi:hypothetical protein
VGARETAKPICDLTRVNVCYTVANSFNVVYFAATAQWPYLVLNLIFLTMSLRGLYTHTQIKRIKMETPTQTAICGGENLCRTCLTMQCPLFGYFCGFCNACANYSLTKATFAHQTRRGR